MKEYDYLIVGQGLAGTVMAQTMLMRNKRILIVEQGKSPTASRVSAGIFNPFTGQRLTKTWMGEILFPFLRTFYRNAEQLTQTQLLHDTPVYMSIDTQEKQNDFLARPQETYEVFQLQVLSRSPYPSINDQLGGFITGLSGWLDVATYLSAFQAYFQKINCWTEAVFSQNDLSPTPEKVYWKGNAFKKVIFCEGIDATKNPLWSWLPFKGVKGEILTVKFLKDPAFTHIVNRGCWILPLGNGYYKIGSTYEFHYRDELPSEYGKKEILAKLHALTSLEIKEIVSHTAAIRPATAERRPFLGQHPLYPDFVIFNGLGTKGVSLAPYFAQHLALHLEKGEPLLPEVDIKKYWRI